MTGQQLRGRRSELRVLAERVHGIRDEGATTLIVGEPGIGKSTLLAAAGEEAAQAGCLIVRTVGVETESQLPYAGLHQLLLPLLGRADRLPSAQRLALSTAFGLADGPAAEPFLVALAAMNLLTEAATDRPIVALVDDLQWLDDSTNEALAFLARRITGDPIVLIVTVRSGHKSPLSIVGLPELELGGLDDTSSRELLGAAGGDLTDADRELILEQALGNPLALVELPAVWRSTNNGVALPGFVPLSARLERAFANRITELPATTRDVLLVAAVNNEDELSEIMAAAAVLSGQPVTMEALDPAAGTGLLRYDGMHVTFRHPLVRSGILQSEPISRHQAANAALAQVLTHHPYRRNWYRAQSIIGTDDVVADELAASHVESIRRGSVMSAIQALDRSAQLTTDSAVRGRRLLLAAELAFSLGRASVVDRFLAAASHNSLSDLDRARMEWLRELPSDGVPGDAQRVVQLCEIARQATAAGDPGLALNLLLGAALRCWWAETGPDARACVVTVTEELTGVEDDPRYLATLGVAEPVLRGAVVYDLLSRFPLESVTDPDVLRLLGMAAHAIGDQPRAADYFDRSEAKARVQGRMGLLTQVLGMQSPVRIDLGDWERAAAAAEEGRRMAAETGQAIWSSGTLASEARAMALVGDAGRAMELAAEAESTASPRRLTCYLAIVQLARGLAYLNTGRHVEAFDAFRRLFDPADPSCHTREGLSGIMFLAEAAVHAGRRDEAATVIAGLERLAEITPSPVLHTQLLYARAVLADDDTAEALYRKGLAHNLARWPWVRARLQLAYGSWLRRQRRVAESRPLLRSAHTTFDYVGATTWAEQARAELRAAGERAAADQHPATDMLSAQELQIARLAAEGLSNREIGQRLFLSHRTVGSHLYRIFPKLNIASRAQLASRLAAG